MTELSDERLVVMIGDLQKINDWLVNSRLPGHEITALNAANTILGAREALLSLRQSHSTGVRATVKPLEWMNHGPHDQTADSAVGQYRILVMDGDWVLFLPGIMPGVRYKSQVTAWTAAQADFERRILSALSPVHKDGEPVGSDAAAIEIADAVIAWMVKYDLLDADQEYRADDIVAVLDELAPDPHPKEAEVTVTEEMVERAARAMELMAFREEFTATDEWFELEQEGRAQALGRARAALVAALSRKG